MITLDDDKITIPRKTWDNLQNDDYFKELIENILDSEELNDSIESSTEHIDLRDYDRKRRKNALHN